MNSRKNRLKFVKGIFYCAKGSFDGRGKAYFRAMATLLGLAMLAGCGGGGSPSVTPLQTGTSTATAPLISAGTWVVMGSSTAAGVRVTEGKKWSDLLQANLSTQGVKIANIARGATYTYNGLSTNTPLVPNRPLPDPSINIDKALSLKPVVLMLAYPTNDTADGYSIDETVNNIASMRNTAIANGVQVLVLSTQPRNLTTAQLAQLQQIDTRLAASVGPCFVNVHQLLAGPDDHLALAYDSGDGIHPNDAGHRVIAEAILKTVNSSLCFRLRNP